MNTRQIIPAWVIGEFVGTFLLVFFGCGSVAAAVTTGAEVGVFQVAIVWGLGIATAIYLTASLSGAHLNPVVTISIAAWSDFPRHRVPGYILTQFLGAMAASAVILIIFGGAIHEFENRSNIVRGQPGSEASAMIFGEFYPNPGGRPLKESNPMRMSQARAFAAEVVGTAILLLVIFCTTDARNHHRPQILTAATIGLTVTMLISLLGPLTMACFNPARDLGPRLFSSLAGWGSIPFTANGFGWLTVYILAPILGGLLGGGSTASFSARTTQPARYNLHWHFGAEYGTLASMGKLMRFFFRLVMAAILFLVCTVASIVFDGLNDKDGKADAALVVDARVPAKGPSPALDRVVEMHRSGMVNSVIVVSSKWLGEGQEGGAQEMAKYLQSHGVPADDVVKSDHGGSMQETGQAVNTIVKAHQFLSVLLVADYYDITRLKVALAHEGTKSLGTVHVGTVNKDDVFKILNSVVELYQYVAKVYLLPEAEEVKKEAQSSLEKAKVEADHAKDKVDQGLNNLPK